MGQHAHVQAKCSTAVVGEQASLGVCLPPFIACLGLKCCCIRSVYSRKRRFLVNILFRAHELQSLACHLCKPELTHCLGNKEGTLIKGLLWMILGFTSTYHALPCRTLVRHRPFQPKAGLGQKDSKGSKQRELWPNEVQIFMAKVRDIHLKQALAHCACSKIL